MAEVTYRLAGGDQRTVQVAAGVSVMQAALSHGVPGIVAECGGQLMCATCHVYVETTDVDVPARSEDELDMLDLAASPVTEQSRLSCQLVLPDQEGQLVVSVAERQI